MEDEKKKKGVKPPPSGYILYLLSNRQRLVDANPSLVVPEVTKRLAAEWSAMDFEQRKPYLDMAEEEKRRFLADPSNIGVIFRRRRNKTSASQNVSHPSSSSSNHPRGAPFAHSSSSSEFPQETEENAEIEHTEISRSELSRSDNLSSSSRPSRFATKPQRSSSTPYTIPLHRATRSDTDTLDGNWPLSRLSMEDHDNSPMLKKPELRAEDLTCALCRRHFASLQAKMEHEQTAEHRMAQDALSSDVTLIPVFSDQFIAYHKQREGALRSLKTQCTQLEIQNSTLTEQIQALDKILDRTTQEARDTEQRNAVLKRHMHDARRALMDAFLHPAPFSHPSVSCPLTLDTFDNYMSQLQGLLETTPDECADLLHRMKRAASSLAMKYPSPINP